MSAPFFKIIWPCLSKKTAFFYAGASRPISIITLVCLSVCKQGRLPFCCNSWGSSMRVWRSRSSSSTSSNTAGLDFFRFWISFEAASVDRQTSQKKKKTSIEVAGANTTTTLERLFLSHSLLKDRKSGWRSWGYLARFSFPSRKRQQPTSKLLFLKLLTVWSEAVQSILYIYIYTYIYILGE